MAYFGTTSTSANPPRSLQPQDIGRTATTAYTLGARIWTYSTTSQSTDPFTANFFVDAANIGMKQGDIVIYVAQTSTAGTSQTLTMGVLGALSTAGAGTLSTFSFISST